MHLLRRQKVTMRVKVTLIVTLMVALISEIPMNKEIQTIYESMRVNRANFSFVGE